MHEAADVETDENPKFTLLGRRKYTQAPVLSLGAQGCHDSAQRAPMQNDQKRKAHVTQSECSFFFVKTDFPLNRI